MNDDFIQSINDLYDRAQENYERMNKVFVHDEKMGYITINIKYEYHIGLDRIPDQEALLGWVVHLCEKNWMNTEYIHEFIERVCKIKGWKINR